MHAIRDLLEGQHPGCQLLGIGFADLSVGGHGHGTPDASAALDDLLGQHVGGAGLACKLGANISTDLSQRVVCLEMRNFNSLSFGDTIFRLFKPETSSMHKNSRLTHKDTNFETSISIDTKPKSKPNKYNAVSDSILIGNALLLGKLNLQPRNFKTLTELFIRSEKSKQ